MRKREETKFIKVELLFVKDVLFLLIGKLHFLQFRKEWLQRFFLHTDASIFVSIVMLYRARAG